MCLVQRVLLISVEYLVMKYLLELVVAQKDALRGCCLLISDTGSNYANIIMKLHKVLGIGIHRQDHMGKSSQNLGSMTWCFTANY